MTSVQLASRFGILEIGDDGKVLEFKEQPKENEAWINGGFFICDPKVIDNIDNDSTIFEKEPLSIISRKGKKIIITMKAFQSQRPRHSIRQLSIFLSNASKYLATEDWFGPPQKATDLENFMRKNFTLVWRFFFRFQII